MFKIIPNTILFFAVSMSSHAFGQVSWGANAHPAQGGSYVRVTFDQQMALLNQMGLSSYRMDLYPDGACPNCRALLSSAIASAKTHGITVLPLLIPDGTPSKYANEAAAYKSGFNMAQEYAKQFTSSGIRVWELGNEYEIYALTGGTCSADDGSTICQYNLATYDIERGLLRGLLDGIHSVNPSALGMVDAGGWCHYAFQKQLLLDGVKFDLTGWHWYSNMGNITNTHCSAGPTNVLGILNSWGKAIWLTEFNSNQSSLSSVQGAWLIPTMSQWSSLASTYNITAAFVYQLLDQIPAASCTAGSGYCGGLADENGFLLSNSFRKRPGL